MYCFSTTLWYTYNSKTHLHHRAIPCREIWNNLYKLFVQEHMQIVNINLWWLIWSLSVVLGHCGTSALREPCQSTSMDDGWSMRWSSSFCSWKLVNCKQSDAAFEGNVKHGTSPEPQHGVMFTTVIRYHGSVFYGNVSVCMEVCSNLNFFMQVLSWACEPHLIIQQHWTFRVIWNNHKLCNFMHRNYAIAG